MRPCVSPQPLERLLSHPVIVRGGVSPPRDYSKHDLSRAFLEYLGLPHVCEVLENVIQPADPSSAGQNNIVFRPAIDGRHHPARSPAAAPRGIERNVVIHLVPQEAESGIGKRRPY